VSRKERKNKKGESFLSGAVAPPPRSANRRAGRIRAAGEGDRPSWPDFREKGEGMR